jgi:hypothetical protein
MSFFLSSGVDSSSLVVTLFNAKAQWPKDAKNPISVSNPGIRCVCLAQGDSFCRQTELSSQYADKHGLFLDASLNLFDEGLSGFTGEIHTKGALAFFLRAVGKSLLARCSVGQCAS